jgi:methylenetetrahydrofolate dehydrogenase (NADP+) / methenyltetrahydrofolate cyclohydrolase
VLLDGRAVARELQVEVGHELDRLCKLEGSCGPATVMVGLDYAASAYERRLRSLARKLGIGYRHYWLNDGASSIEVVQMVEQRNEDLLVHGILGLRPLPPQVAEAEVFARLDPHKDIEAVHPENAGLLALGNLRFLPSTPAAAFHVLDGWLDDNGRDRPEFYRRSTIVVVAPTTSASRRWLSDTLGTPSSSPATSGPRAPATWPTSRSGPTSSSWRLVSRTSSGPNTSPTEPYYWTLGSTRWTDPATGTVHLVGDIDLAAVRHRARAATPVPGGIGPVTDVWLMKNCVEAAQRRHRRAVDPGLPGSGDP